MAVIERTKYYGFVTGDQAFTYPAGYYWSPLDVGLDAGRLQWPIPAGPSSGSPSHLFTSPIMTWADWDVPAGYYAKAVKLWRCLFGSLWHLDTITDNNSPPSPNVGAVATIAGVTVGTDPISPPESGAVRGGFAATWGLNDYPIPAVSQALSTSIQMSVAIDWTYTLAAGWTNYVRVFDEFRFEVYFSTDAPVIPLTGFDSDCN